MAFLPFQLPCASCAFLSQQFESGVLGIQQQVAALLSIYLAADSVGMLAHKTQQEDENENSHHVKLISGPVIDNSQEPQVFFFRADLTGTLVTG